MERLQEPINCFFGGQLNLEYLEQGNDLLGLSYGYLLNTESLRFGEPFSNPSLQDKMPFLQRLQGIEPTSVSEFTEPTLQFLLRLQQQQQQNKAWESNYLTEMDSRIQQIEIESCITNLSEAHSPIKSETKELYPHSSSYPEVASSVCNPESDSPENSCKNGNHGSSPVVLRYLSKRAPQMVKERRKRKRPRPCKNEEDVESQRMTHIAVERNRRKQMNEHLNALRALMPISFIQRGDQASIIGGAIDLVKELEQHLQSLQAKKLMQESDEGYSDRNKSIPFNGFFTSTQYTTFSYQSDFKYLVDCSNYNKDEGETECSAKRQSSMANIEVTLIKTHANLKILSPRRPGQLIKAVAAFEDLCLTILHLNITSLESSVLYSFNLKIDEDCKLGSADEIAAAVHQIFSFINSN